MTWPGGESVGTESEERSAVLRGDPAVAGIVNGFTLSALKPAGTHGCPGAGSVTGIPPSQKTSAVAASRFVRIDAVGSKRTAKRVPLVGGWLGENICFVIPGEPVLQVPEHGRLAGSRRHVREIRRIIAILHLILLQGLLEFADFDADVGDLDGDSGADGGGGDQAGEDADDDDHREHLDQGEAGAGG